MSESSWGHNPGRWDCEMECGSVTKGGEQPRMKRLIGLDEESPKQEGRRRMEGCKPVCVGMTVSGCSTTTQSGPRRAAKGRRVSTGAGRVAEPRRRRSGCPASPTHGSRQTARLCRACVEARHAMRR
eukprot:679981-Pleurochrysis_carterae.AAC.1